MESTVASPEDIAFNSTWATIDYEGCRKASKFVGPGVHLFRRLRFTRNDGSNCEYYYFEQDSEFFENLVNHVPKLKMLVSNYDPLKHILVCVQIPKSNSGPNYLSDAKIIDRYGKAQ